MHKASRAERFWERVRVAKAKADNGVAWNVDDLKAMVKHKKGPKDGKVKSLKAELEAQWALRKGNASPPIPPRPTAQVVADVSTMPTPSDDNNNSAASLIAELEAQQEDDEVQTLRAEV